MPRVDHAKAELGIYTFGKDSPNRPGSVQYIIDCAGLRDPGSSGSLRKTYTDGRPGEVQQYVNEDPRVRAIIETIRTIAFMHLRSQGADGKWLSFGLQDHHGKWIAPAVGELAADALSNAGYGVSLHHSDCGVKL
jgi:hypothetical protein